MNKLKGLLSRIVPKRSEEKNELLQSYFTSLMSLLLCVTMFFGTTYAWFTSEVTNAANEIYIGVLDVELEKQNKDDGKWVSLSAVDESGKNTTQLFDRNIRWEPGYTSLETVRVTNTGELAFKYVLQFTDGKAEQKDDQSQTGFTAVDAQSLVGIAQYFDVWVFDHKANENKAEAVPKPANYAALTDPGSGWANVGTLDQILAGAPVFQGDLEANTVAPQATDVEEPARTYTIALHMKEDADASVMGHKITLNVKLIAYQAAAEKDDFDSNTYDQEITAVSDPAGLNEILNASGDALMTVNVDIGDAESRLSMNGGVLDGNGKSILYTVTREEDEPSLDVLTTTGGTVRNLTIDGAEAGRALYVTNLTSDLLVSNCTLSGTDSFDLNSGDQTEFTVSFVNTTFKNAISYADVAESVEFAYCTFEDVLKPSGSATLINCTFKEGGKLDLSGLAEGETITLINCTYKDIEVEMVAFTVEDGVIKFDNGTLDISEHRVVIVPRADDSI